MHLHVLFFGDDFGRAELEKFLAATVPAEEPLGSYVRGSQVDRSSESKWPVYDGPGGWDDLADALRLTHTREDDELGLRAFCMDVMDGVPCHQDWQTSDGEALLLAYVTKYVAKFSDAAYDEWFNDDASADCVARRVCFEYHPLEPEMVLQLSGALFRQYRMSTVSGGFRAISAPWPGMEAVPEFVHKYTACKWRGEEMSLLEWLRKTTNEGEVVGWLKQKHQEEILKRAHTRHLECGGALEVKAFRKALLTQYRVKRHENDAPSFVQATYEFLQQNGTPMTEGAQDLPELENFAREYTSAGEKVVAVDMVYQLNDRYYGQWLAMHVPFRDLEELRSEEAG